MDGKNLDSVVQYILINFLDNFFEAKRILSRKATFLKSHNVGYLSGNKMTIDFIRKK